MLGLQMSHVSQFSAPILVPDDGISSCLPSFVDGPCMFYLVIPSPFSRSLISTVFSNDICLIHVITT